MGDAWQTGRVIEKNRGAKAEILGRRSEGSSAALEPAVADSRFQEFSSWLSDGPFVAQSAMAGEFIEQKLPKVIDQPPPPPKASLPARPWEKAWERVDSH